MNSIAELFPRSDEMPRSQQGKRLDLEQFFTPAWAANRLVEHYYPDLGGNDLVVDAGTGRGAFLGEIPSEVPAVGIELDPELAALARERTGREVIVGDFCTVKIPGTPTLVIGNPPFGRKVINGFLERAHQLLPSDGRCGFIMPAQVFSYAGPFHEWAGRWSITQDIIPRQLFPRLSVPLVFAQFCKGGVRRHFGFFLFDETRDVGASRKRVQLLLVQGARRKSVWRAAVEHAIEALGGAATSQQLYAYLASRRPTDNNYWRDKIRQILNLGPFEKRSDGAWTAAAA